MMKLSSLKHRALPGKMSIGLIALAMDAVLTGSITADDRLLEPIIATQVASIENFVAADRFRVGNRIGNRRLGLVGSNFAEHFLSKAESYAPAASLVVTELRFTMGDTSLTRMFDAEKAPLAHVAHVYAVMVLGEAGASHTDWRSNIAYVRSPVDHRLWAVHWSVNHSGEWTIGAVYVPHAALDWAAGTRVLSPELARPTSKTQLNARVGE
jgi:hypothetical protein